MPDSSPAGTPPPLDEALARALFSQSPFSIVIYDAAGHPLAVNAAFERLWGVTRDSVPPGYSVLSDPELERQGVLPTIQRAFQGETVVTPPVRYDISQVAAGSTGRALWTQGHFFPVHDAGGRLAYVVLTHIDLSEVKRSEEALRVQEERLRVAQRAARIGTFDWHIPSGRVMWTEEAERVFGLPPGSFEGTLQGWERRLLPEDLSRLRREMSDVMTRGEREMDFSFRIRRPDGEVRWIHGSAELQYADDGTPLRMVGVNLDATERVRSEEELRRAKEEAETANRSKADFLAVMSHELRTPLNAIGGYAELLELGIHGPVTEAQREDLRRISQAQRHLLGLINEVLSYARIEAGAVVYFPQELRVEEVLTAAESVVLPQAQAKGLRLRLVAPPAGLTAWADREKTQQVLLNLLSNAIKFTDPGGRIEVSAESRDSMVAIHVADTGMGIPPDRLQSVFEPFVQVGRALNSPVEGAGLGLAISRDLARGMSGDVVAESRPGEGSTFSLLLPLSG